MRQCAYGLAVKSFVTLAVSGVLLTLSACASSQDPTTAPPETLGHVHGLGVDPADGVLYAATHTGVFRLDADEGVERVAGRWQDTMAFTVVGPGRFLASGHPDLSEDLPVHLGLIESTDAARNWSPLSLQGKADFHALDATPERVVAYDSLSGRLLTSTDRREWTLVDTQAVVDVVLDPANSDRALATTARGDLIDYRLEQDGRISGPSAPPLAWLEWPQEELLVGMTMDGDLQISEDGGGEWRRVGGPPGDPQVLDATEDVMHVATTSGIYASEDLGVSWQQVLGP